MNPIFSRIKVWVSGEVLYASDLNTEFNNLLTHMVPTGIAGASQTVATMQTTTSPGGVGTESLAADLYGELQRLRYVIARIIDDTQATQWYAAAPRGLGAGQLGVQTADIADKAVTTAKIDDAAVTTTQLADNSVTPAKIVDHAVTKAKLSTSLAIGSSYTRSSTTIGAQNFNSLTMTDIAGAYVTLQTQGGAVKLFFTPGHALSGLNTPNYLNVYVQGVGSVAAGATSANAAVQAVNINTGKTFTATFSSGSSTITVSSALGLYNGMPVRDLTTPTNIPSGAYITNISGTTITLSQNTAGASAGGGDAMAGGAVFNAVFSTGATSFTASDTSNLFPGMQITDVTTGGNFASNTYITSISGSTVSISAATLGNSNPSPGDVISGGSTAFAQQTLNAGGYYSGANSLYNSAVEVPASAFTFIDERVRGYPGTYTYQLQGVATGSNLTTVNGGLTGPAGNTIYLAAQELS